MNKIIAIATATPKYKYEQKNLAAWMHQRFDKNDLRIKRVLKILYEKSRIAYRYSVLPDFKKEVNEPLLFQSNLEEPKIENRLSIYSKEAIKLAKKSAEDSLKKAFFEKEKITHLITVSCTGMSAPGIEIQLKSELQLNDSVNCHAVNFVGCYAVFPALKMADAFCSSNKDAKVLIVAVELCTIHFQNKIDEDHLLSNAIFGDGAASCIVCPTSKSAKIGFELMRFAGILLPEGTNDMAWNIHSSGFLMRLSAYIPRLVDKGISSIIEQLLNELNLAVPDISYWALHPGGRKIIEACEKALVLSEPDFKYSYETMRDYGNLSAPTILFVLKKILEEDEKSNENKLCLALGFGPGLTMESALLKITSSHV